MSIIFLKLLGWLTGGGLQSIVGLATAYLGKKDDDATTRLQTRTSASTAIVQAVTAADVSINALKVQENAENAKWWVTAWEKPLLFYLCLMHFGAIMIDTTFSMGWRIPAPPEPVYTWEGIILLSDVIVMSTAGLTQKIVASIWK